MGAAIYSDTVPPPNGIEAVTVEEVKSEQV